MSDVGGVSTGEDEVRDGLPVFFGFREVSERAQEVL